MRPWWILAGASTGLFMLMLDSTAIALALPSIRLELGASNSGIQWAQNIYLLVLAALVIALGRLGDVFGRRLLFCAGLVVFAAGSVVCAVADSIAVLVAGRAVQGVGGAAMLALSLAIATGAFPTEKRARAIGIWAAVSSVALAIGPLVGGGVVELASWRWLFWLNLPLAVLGLAILLDRHARVARRERRAPPRPRRPRDPRRRSQPRGARAGGGQELGLDLGRHARRAGWAGSFCWALSWRSNAASPRRSWSSTCFAAAPTSAPPPPRSRSWAATGR